MLGKIMMPSMMLPNTPKIDPQDSIFIETTWHTGGSIAHTI
jgi:hypothetical protein